MCQMFILPQFIDSFTKLLQSNFQATLMVNNGPSNDHHPLMINKHTTTSVNLNLFVQVVCGQSSWIVRRNLKDFAFLDAQLHKCVFDRQHSKLNVLTLSAFSSLDTFVCHVCFALLFSISLTIVLAYFLKLGNDRTNRQLS